VRSAVGAGRARLVRQLLAESLLLATLGSAAGLLVAWWTVRIIVALGPTSIPALSAVTIDARVIAFAIGSRRSSLLPSASFLRGTAREADCST
jgi:putative ABC transport system permease protein